MVRVIFRSLRNAAGPGDHVEADTLRAISISAMPEVKPVGSFSRPSSSDREECGRRNRGNHLDTGCSTLARRRFMRSRRRAEWSIAGDDERHAHPAEGGASATAISPHADAGRDRQARRTADSRIGGVRARAPRGRARHERSLAPGFASRHRRARPPGAAAAVEPLGQPRPHAEAQPAHSTDCSMRSRNQERASLSLPTLSIRKRCTPGEDRPPHALVQHHDDEESVSRGRR